MSFHPGFMRCPSLFSRGEGAILGQGIELVHAKTGQDGKLPLPNVMLVGVFVVDLDQTADEKFLLFRGTGLPIVRLIDSHSEATLTGPLLELSLLFVPWDPVNKVFYV
jgi:hypothetical protein